MGGREGKSGEEGRSAPYSFLKVDVCFIVQVAYCKCTKHGGHQYIDTIHRCYELSMIN